MKIFYPDKSIDIISAGAFTLNKFIKSPIETIETLSGQIFQMSSFDYAEALSGGGSTDEDIDFDVNNVGFRVDYIFISRADYMINRSAGDITVTVSGSTSSSFTTTEDISFTLNSSSFNDRHSLHYAQELTFTSDYRYYRVNFSSATENVLKFKNIWIGEAFEFTNPAEQPFDVNFIWEDFWSINLAEYVLRFPGVANSKKVEFQNEIEKFRNIGNIVLWDNNNDYFLDHKLVYGKVMEADFLAKGKTDDYDLVLRVMDVI